MTLRIAMVMGLLLMPGTTAAEQRGQLFWEGINESISQEMRNGKLPFSPFLSDAGVADSNSVRIAIIDSGVTRHHPQLSGYIVASKDFTGEGIDDVLGHGTIVALIALSVATGHPKGSIVSAKVVDHHGDILQSHVTDAIRWAASVGAKVINLSLGFKGQRADNEMLCDVIKEFPNLIFLAASGNYGPNIEVYPARCGNENLISVGATTVKGEIETYSGLAEVYAPGTARIVTEADYYYEKGQLLAQTGKLNEARAQYNRSLAAEPNPESELQIGLIDIKEGATEKALEHFGSAIRLNPGMPEAHEFMGAGLMLLEQYEKAEGYLREAIILYGEAALTSEYQARAHYNLGQTFLKLARPAEARIEFLQVKKLSPRYRGINEALELSGNPE